MNKQLKKGFTLIELLMVIAIIGILAGILIPTVGSVRKQANIAASKSQISNYITAMSLFKGEYGYIPTFGATGGTTKQTFTLDTPARCEIFIETLSGRAVSNGAPVQVGGNRRSIAFHSFSESEFLEDDENQIADRFGNTNINIVIDVSGTGQLTGLPRSDGSTTDVRAEATAYVVEDTAENFPGYELY